MDKTISRKYVYDTLFVDSAFRRPRDSSYDYNVYFESNDSNSARRMKDVVSIDVINAHLPVRNNNILAGLNSFDIHILEDEEYSAVITNATELQGFFTSSYISGAVTVSSEIHTSPQRYVKLKLGSTSSVLLCDSNPFPTFESEFHTDSSLFTLLVSPLFTQTSSPILVDDNNNFVSPFTFRIMKQSSVPVTLQPGYYPSDTAMINQLWSSLQYVDPSGMGTNPEINLQFSDLPINSETGVGGDGLGWSSRREPQALWSLYFRTNNTTYSHIVLTKRFHKHNFDLLSQFGLQYETVGDNWNEQTIQNELRQAFFMKSYEVTVEDTVLNTIHPSTTERIDEQIDISTATRIFELRFNSLNLIPRRYVNVIIEQIPTIGCKLTNDNISNVVCRIDLTASHLLQYSDSISSVAQGGNNVQEGSSNNAFTSFTSNEFQQNTSFFEPITLKGLNIKLVDNLGIQYDSSTDHTIELRLTRLGDAIIPFYNPTHNISSLTHSYRNIQESDEVKYRKQRNATKKRIRDLETTQIQHINPIYQWSDDNKWAIIGTLSTFFGTLYLSYYFTKRPVESNIHR